ncbi:hypothetical protein G6F62_011981 [Rhizopus arrhizus]|nr:hypothetical protein G6F23_011712 [Rhizopus arrhizus]KAG1319156.1 hypothetical protein G6F62_011981 [Rhizopus arrhizus]KAG1392272.1 hypothetical protein G6F60_012148 [Rhizopus arrhizus]
MSSDTNELELIQRLTEAETSKEIVNALIKKRTFDQTAKALTAITATASTRTSSTTAASSDRTSVSTASVATVSTTSLSTTEALNIQNKKFKLSAKDNVHIGNLRITLGEFLIEYYENLLIESPKDKYFSYLSQNFIIDISNESQKSQLNYFGVETTTIIKEKYTRELTECVNHNITEITDLLKKGRHRFHAM